MICVAVSVWFIVLMVGILGNSLPATSQTQKYRIILVSLWTSNFNFIQNPKSKKSHSQSCPQQNGVLLLVQAAAPHHIYNNETNTFSC